MDRVNTGKLLSLKSILLGQTDHALCSSQNALIFAPGLVTGRMFDKGYLKLPMSIASVILVVATFLTAQCTHYWHFLLCQGFATGVSTFSRILSICFEILMVLSVFALNSFPAASYLAPCSACSRTGSRSAKASRSHSHLQGQPSAESPSLSSHGT